MAATVCAEADNGIIFATNNLDGNTGMHCRNPDSLLQGLIRRIADDGNQTMDGRT